MFEFEDWEDEQDTDEPEVEETDEPEVDENAEPEVEDAGGDDKVDHFDRILGLLGDDEDAISDEDLAKISEREIERMDPVARALVRSLKRKAGEQVEAERTASASTKQEVEALLAQTRAEQDNLARSRKAFAEMFGNDKIKEFIKAGKSVKVEDLDPTDPADMRKLAQAEAAQGIAPLFDEIITRADEQRRLANIEDVKKRYAEHYVKPGFEDRVRAVLTEWKTAGQSIGGRIDEAHRETILRDILKEREAEKARRSEAARRSAQHVGRRGTGAGEQTPQGPPPEVRRNPERLAAWVSANPKQAAAYAATLRR